MQRAVAPDKKEIVVFSLLSVAPIALGGLLCIAFAAAVEGCSMVWTPLRTISGIAIILFVVGVWGSLALKAALLGHTYEIYVEPLFRSRAYAALSLAISVVVPTLVIVGVPLLVAGMTFNPETVRLSETGLSAATWASLDTIPLVSLPGTLGLSEPTIAGTPIAFRLALVLVRIGTIVGVVGLAVSFYRTVANLLETGVVDGDDRSDIDDEGGIDEVGDEVGDEVERGDLDERDGDDHEQS